MKYQFICYPKCTTCQKAQKWLDEKGVEYEIRHIKEAPPTYAELKKWYHENPYELKRYFNTSGQLYKSMELKGRLPAMTEEEQIRLLATDGMLVKRPLLACDDFVLVGFKEQEWKEKI
ncbi:MAG: arsenate reductase family protein [Oscillospiraceae bacterium]|nr:arsenate reductase family protein [Oscillospiraceae bacterium]